MKSKILIVEDEAKLREVLCDYFISKGDQPFEAPNGVCALELLQEYEFDAVLLDIMMPGLDGLSVCRAVRRENDVPIIFLTALSDEEDKLLGYELGADDYVTKPFSLAVLRARLSVLRRRCQKQASRIYEIGELRLDFEKLLFYRGEEELSLSRNEQKLLRLFVENQGQLLPRERLIERLWDEGGEFVDENALSVTVNRLRRKLGAAEKGCDHIQTVYGQGYIWKKEP